MEEGGKEGGKERNSHALIGTCVRMTTLHSPESRGPGTHEPTERCVNLP